MEKRKPGAGCRKLGSLAERDAGGYPPAHGAAPVGSGDGEHRAGGLRGSLGGFLWGIDQAQAIEDHLEALIV